MKTLILKTYNQKYYPVLLFGIYLILFGIMIYYIDFYSKEELENILKKVIPINLKANFFLILLGILFCFEDIKYFIKKFLNFKGLSILILIIIAFSFTSFVVPRTHRIYYDEDIYANVGQTITLTNQTGYCSYGTFEYDEYFPHWITYNKEPSGWPYLISIVFNIFGVDENYLFFLNNLLFCISVLSIFLISWLMTSDYLISFISALTYTIIPHNMVWSNTLAAEPSAACFSGLSILFLLLFLKTDQKRYLFLLSLIIPFSCQMRPESMMILVVSFIAIIIFSPKVLIERRTWTFAILALAAFIPQFIHFYAVSGNSWGAEGAKFSLSFVSKNLHDNGIYYFNNKEFPLILTIFAIIGTCFSFKFFKQRIIIFLWFLFFWGIFIFFYAGSYKYGADVRFALLSFMPLSLLAGFGISIILNKLPFTGNNWKISIILLIMICSFAGFLPLVRQLGQEAWGARYDHDYAKEFIKKIPKRSIVLTQNPTMFLLWGQSAIQTYSGTNNLNLIKDLMSKYQGHVYFHYNYWCNTKNIRNIRLCQEIKDKYLLVEVAKESEQDYDYGLYKMSIK